MSVALLFALAVLLCGVYVWLGWRAAKDVRTGEDYFLMGRKLTFFPLCLTLLATQVGGGALLGAAQEAYAKGWIVLLYPTGISIGLLVLGLGFGSRLRRLNLSTVAELFEKVYGVRKQRLFASGLSILSFAFILVGQSIAARQFFLAIGMGEILFIVFWLVFVAYTVMGGLKAVVDTDIIQALLIVGCLVVAWLSIDGTQLNPQAVVVASVPSTLNVPWSSWLLMPLLFMLIEQDMGQRCFAAKTASIVRPAALTASVLLFACSSIAIAFGVLAKEQNLQAEGGASILIVAVQALTNPTVSFLFMGAILMAIASSADSILCSISSNLSCDFLPAQQLKTARLLTLVIGIAALGAGYLFSNVVTVLILSYELSVCVLCVPVLAAFLTHKPSPTGAWGAMLGGLAGFFLFRMVLIALPREVLTLSLSLAGYCIGACLFSYEAEPQPETSNG